MPEIEIHCDDCQLGYSSFVIARKLTSIHLLTASKELMANGQKCMLCIHCKMGKRKAKVIAKASKKFRSLDLFVKVKCPDCNSELFSRKESHYHCTQCGLVD